MPAKALHRAALERAATDAAEARTAQWATPATCVYLGTRPPGPATRAYQPGLSTWARPPSQRFLDPAFFRWQISPGRFSEEPTATRGRGPLQTQ